MRAWFTAIATTGLALGLASFASGAEGAAAGTNGSVEAGAAKSATCVACHGPAGNSANPEWPTLAGQNQHYLQQQITLFRDAARPNPLMYPMVKDLTDQDILDLAAYFSRQTPNAFANRSRCASPYTTSPAMTTSTPRSINTRGALSASSTSPCTMTP
jgi:cytochrome c553